MKKALWIVGALLLIGRTPTFAEESVGEKKSADKPNVLLIVLDDLGYSDLSFQNPETTGTRTPHIDSIAAKGVKFSEAYVTCPVCGPTRAGLLTGRYQQRFGFELNIGNPPADKGLDTKEKLLSDYLKKAGYRTGAVGKWHLGVQEQFHPNQRGFDEFFGFLGGAHPYTTWGAAEKAPTNYIQRNGKQLKGKEYLTTAFGKEAVKFISESAEKEGKKQPFFLYLAFNAVHTPMEAVGIKKEDNETQDAFKRRAYAGMLKAADDAVGKVLDTLREKKLDEDTLIVLLSDNGGATFANTANNLPLRGSKGTVYEGGIRVPYVIKWDKKLKGGGTFDRPVSSLDVVPTVLEAAGVELPENVELDGVSLLPYLTGKNNGTPHEDLFWRWSQGFKAVRSGDWKLLKNQSEEFELYNVKNDISEKKNLVEQEKELVEKLQKKLKAWEGELIDPLWGRATEGRRAARNK